MGRGRQGGIGIIPLVLLLAIVGFVGLLALRIAPIYMDSLTVRSVVDDVGNNNELRGSHPNEVRSALSRRFRVNNVGFLEDDDIAVERSGDSISIVVAYERRFPLVANLDGVASFREEAEVDP